MTRDVSDYLRRVERFNPVRWTGKITKVLGTTLECEGFRSSVGDLCRVDPIGEAPSILAEVVGFREGRAIMMPLSHLHGIGPGSQVAQWRKPLGVRVGSFLLGRVLDGLGNPIDGKGPLPDGEEWPLHRDSPMPLSREPVERILGSGISAIDGLISIGSGQRMGIFAGSGVGKSTLLGMIAKRSQADVNVIAMIGERGIEVRGFLEKVLGVEALRRSVVVVATSDTPAQQRFKGSFLAITIAEYFREQGRSVMFMMDSVTRLAAAVREIGLSRGEPPTVKGYPPSFYATLPQVVERLGATSGGGSITGLFTVLVEGDDMNDPVADTMRSLLDGHIVLSRAYANRGHFPAIDVLSSTSRVMSDIVDSEHLSLARRFREIYAVYEHNEDLINIGAYKSGSNAEIDLAIRCRGPMNRFLRQSSDEAFTPAEIRQRLAAVVPAEGGEG